MLTIAMFAYYRPPYAAPYSAVNTTRGVHQIAASADTVDAAARRALSSGERDGVAGEQAAQVLLVVLVEQRDPPLEHGEAFIAQGLTVGEIGRHLHAEDLLALAGQGGPGMRELVRRGGIGGGLGAVLRELVADPRGVAIRHAAKVSRS